MFVYGKMSANAVAIMSYLAAAPSGQAGCSEIASARRLSPAIAAKLLTQLASAGLVKGQPGPRGGYSLNRPAKKISLHDIAVIFERVDSPSVCPFGEGWCGTGDPCPIHDRIQAIFQHHENFMKNTRLSVFASGRGTKTGIRPHPTALQKRFAKTSA